MKTLSLMGTVADAGEIANIIYLTEAHQINEEVRHRFDSAHGGRW